MYLEVGWQFDNVVADLYKDKYLHVPDGKDLKSTQGCRWFVGLFPHVLENWPKAWQGLFQGKEGKPIVVLEALCDYHMFFWYASYGYAGCLNDINILNLSPFLD
jgi:Plant transposon protein